MWKKYSHYQAPAKALHLVLLKVTDLGGQCACSPLVCRERGVADAIPGSSTHLQGLIDLLLGALKTQKSIISVSMCLLIRLPASAPCVYLIVPAYAHTHVNMHTRMHTYRHAQTGY